jgi:hypothetical protein
VQVPGHDRRAPDDRPGGPEVLEQPLGADPGPALVELNPGTAGERTDMCAGISPPRRGPSPGRCSSSRPQPNETAVSR